MVKEVSHYVKKVQEKFPFLSQSEISRILTFGLRRYAYANRENCDVLLCHRDEDPMTAFCGRLFTDTFKHFKQWCHKFRMKERLMWVMRKKQWDGYYYIGLDQEHHDIILNQKGKTKHFEDAYFTKIKKELYHNKIVKHIWKVPWGLDCGWKFYKKSYKTDQAEYVGPNKYEEYHDCFLGKFK